MGCKQLFYRLGKEGTEKLHKLQNEHVVYLATKPLSLTLCSLLCQERALLGMPGREGTFSHVCRDM